MARLQDFQTVTPSGSNNLLIVQSQGQGLATVNTVGQKIATDTTISSLSTASKKIAGAINEINSTTCTITAGSSMPTGFPIAKLDRHGKICILSFDSQLPVKNYSSSDVLWKVTPAPKRATRGLFTLGSASNIAIVTAFNNGEIRFNASQNVTSASYLIGELVYYTDD